MTNEASVQLSFPLEGFAMRKHSHIKHDIIFYMTNSTNSLMFQDPMCFGVHLNSWHSM